VSDSILGLVEHYLAANPTEKRLGEYGLKPSKKTQLVRLERSRGKWKSVERVTGKSVDARALAELAWSAHWFDVAGRSPEEVGLPDFP
jgi:hypothetical protein